MSGKNHPQPLSKKEIKDRRKKRKAKKAAKESVKKAIESTIDEIRKMNPEVDTTTDAELAE